MNMNVHQVVFLSALCAGNIRPVTARLGIYTGATRGRGSKTFYFSSRDNRKFLCKDDCKGGNILVETEADEAVNGRYSVKYKNISREGVVRLESTLTVTITDLKKSDTGRYRCGLGGIASPRAHSDFQLRVIDAPIHGNSRFARTDVEGETIKIGCSEDHVPGGWKFFCRGNCVKEEDIIVETSGKTAQSGRFSLKYKERSLFGLEVTISNLDRSDTGWYRCGYGRALTAQSYKTFPLIVIADPGSTESPPLTTEKTSADPSSTESPPLTTEKTSADPGSTESPPLMTEKTSSDWPVYVHVILVVITIIVVVLGLALILLFIHRKMRPHGLNRRGQMDDMNMKLSSVSPSTPRPHYCRTH